MLGIIIIAVILSVFGTVELIGSCYDPAWYRKWSGSYERLMLGDKTVRSMGFVMGALFTAIGLSLGIGVVIEVGHNWAGILGLSITLVFAQITYTISGATLFAAPKARLAYRRNKR
ncbi:hypothetical protein G4Y79_22085 [Phototrophicus methaneseepsis]|uniref:Uncharacterized protein n=1 Tax=Phototrophicus methaneseepsis TaxID=2710758 RepID=A0A7S8E8J3_9CHLR|nr:hypothetical protein [Phototrophicus methaneseepsis]QPC82342.1 hypothetical protein G4Y79_22085 [Phototrophicus methaneseepsis]